MKEMEGSYLIDRNKFYNLFEKGIIDESGAPIIQKDETDIKI